MRVIALLITLCLFFSCKQESKNPLPPPESAFENAKSEAN